MSDTLDLPAGSFTKVEWALKLRNHFKPYPLLGMKPWEDTFEKLVEGGNFKQEQSEYILVGSLEEKDVLKVLGEVQSAAFVSILQKLKK